MLAHIILQRGKGLADLRGNDAATLAYLAFASSLPPYHLAKRLDEVIRGQPTGQGTRDFHREVATGDDDRDAIAIGSVERLIREEEQVLFAVVDSLQHQPDTVDVDFFDLRTAARRQLLAKARGFLLETLHLGLQGSNPGRQLRWCRSEGVAEFAQHAFVIAHLLLRGRAGAHLNPTNARADAAVVGDQGQADLAASLDVCPSAKFTRPVAEGNDPDQIAVLLVEEGDRAGFDRLVEWELLDPAHQVRADLLVEQARHAIDLVRRQGPGEAEIEGCVVGLHRGTSLDGLLAQDIAQGPVQEVRCRVMSRHCLTPRGIHHSMDSIAWLQPVRGDLDAMPDRLTLGLNIDDASRGALPGQRPGVGRLPAALGVKRGLVQEYVGVLWLAGHRENIGDSGVAFQPVISEEPAGAPGQRRGKM